MRFKVLTEDTTDFHKIREIFDHHLGKDSIAKMRYDRFVPNDIWLDEKEPVQRQVFFDIDVDEKIPMDNISYLLSYGCYKEHGLELRDFHLMI